MLHIAIVVESFATTSETFITNKVLQLCKRGHQVTVFTHRHNSDIKLQSLYALHTVSNLTIVRPSIPAGKLQWAQLLLQRPNIFFQAAKGGSLKKGLLNNLLLAALSAKNFDVIHFEFSALAILYADVIALLKPVTVVSCRGTAEKVKPLTLPNRKAQLTDLFNKVDSIHCVSADMARTISPWCAQPQKIFINRPSIDVDYFKRSQPYVAVTKLTVVSVGRFTFQKGYLIGLLAVQKLKRQNIAFEWLIAGDGPSLEEVIFHVHTLGLQSQVVLLGKKNKEEILELYNRADIFFLPSVYEGIANVVLEAMAMELPVVATKSGGLQEVIDHEIDGLLADVYDHDALGQQLISLAVDFEKRKRLGAQARLKVNNHFTLQRQIDEFERKYSVLVQTKTSIA